MFINEVAYGIHVHVYGNAHINKILDDYKDEISHSSKLSLLEKGATFVYIKSTYEGIQSSISEYIHCEDKTKPEPILSDREQKAIGELISLCYCNPKRLMWVRYADTLCEE